MTIDPIMLQKAMAGAMKAFNCGATEALDRVRYQGVTTNGKDWIFLLVAADPVSDKGIQAVVTPRTYFEEDKGIVYGDLRHLLGMPNWTREDQKSIMRFTGQPQTVEAARADLVRLGCEESWGLYEHFEAKGAPHLVEPPTPRPEKPVKEENKGGGLRLFLESLGFDPDKATIKAKGGGMFEVSQAPDQPEDGGASFEALQPKYEFGSYTKIIPALLTDEIAAHAKRNRAIVEKTLTRGKVEGSADAAEDEANWTLVATRAVERGGQALTERTFVCWPFGERGLRAFTYDTGTAITAIVFRDAKGIRYDMAPLGQEDLPLPTFGDIAVVQHSEYGSVMRLDPFDLTTYLDTDNDHTAPLAFDDNGQPDLAAFGLTSQPVPAGTVIAVLGPEGELEHTITLPQGGTAWCKGFGDNYTSDHWILIESGGAWISIGDEPIDVTAPDAQEADCSTEEAESLRKARESGATIIFHHM